MRPGRVSTLGGMRGTALGLRCCGAAGAVGQQVGVARWGRACRELPSGREMLQVRGDGGCGAGAALPGGVGRAAGSSGMGCCGAVGGCCGAESGGGSLRARRCLQVGGDGGGRTRPWGCTAGRCGEQGVGVLWGNGWAVCGGAEA